MNVLRSKRLIQAGLSWCDGCRQVQREVKKDMGDNQSVGGVGLARSRDLDFVCLPNQTRKGCNEPLGGKFVFWTPTT